MFGVLDPSMRIRTISVLFVALAVAGPAGAQSRNVRDEAADAFDRGVKHFEAAEYELAARAFARADELMPAASALKNAIAAARKAGAYLLVTELHARAERRAVESPELAAQAREALAEARQRLAELNLSCKPAPCAITLDDERVEPGQRWVLPGSHSVRATAEGGARAEESLSLAPGAQYRIVLHPVAEGAAPIPTEVSRVGAASEKPAPEDRADDDRPLSPTVFWIGVAASAGLAAVTTWSGLDALSAKDDLPSQPTSAQSDDVRSKVTRTDLLLGGTLVVAGVTTYAGFALVDWDGGSARASVSPTTGGAMATLEGRF